MCDPLQLRQGMSSPQAAKNSSNIDLSPELREQLDAVWRKHIELMAERLLGEWRADAERVVAQYYDEKMVASSAAQRSLNERLNQAVRRFRGAESHASWVQALLDTATHFCRRAALFSTLNQRLRFEDGRGLSEPAAGLDIPLASAPAFASAVETLDPLMILAGAIELSESVMSSVGVEEGRRAQILPLVSNGRVVAVLYAEPDENAGSASALELLASMAGATLENRMAGAPPTGLLAIAAGERSPKKDWASLPREERQLHLKAQRFASIQAAELRVGRGSLVVQGQIKRDIYGTLKEEMDRVRSEFRSEFMDASPNMVDYLHLEFVRTLANDDHALLGPDYPGPLV
jgi:hypothetical protein